MSDTKKKRTVAAGEFKQKCLRLMDEVNETGLQLVITKRGVPIAQLGPLNPEDRGQLWPDMSELGTIMGDLIAPATDPSEWNVLAD